MSDWSGKLLVAHGYMSWAAMSRETGLPLRVLTAIRTGARQPPSEFLPALRNIWSRTSYAYMKGAGVPINQATRMRGGGLDTVTGLSDTATRVLDFMTRGAVKMRLRGVTNWQTHPAYQANYEYMRDKILGGMQRSITDVDYMPHDYDYLKRFLEENPDYKWTY